MTKTIKRIISILLTVALLMACLPIVTMAAEETAYSRVVDESTMDNWKKYFDLNNLDTSNAGGVWTDKSVFKDADAFDGKITMLDDGKNFLTALSAIAANKEVVGYSTIPTDTVFVLDVSGSMDGNEDDLVKATNDAIKKLLNENKNNRVGVVVYSASGSFGSSTYEQSVKRLLPIGRYTTQNDVYLTENNNVVSVSQNVRIEGQTGPSNLSDNRKNVSGGTYIQAGLFEAYKMFDEVPDSDIVIGDNNWQSGEYRMPILVLMSDGAPTTGTSYFDDVENSQYTRVVGQGRNQRTETVKASNVGNGSDSNMTAGQGFLVQLTASYVKNKIENKYKVKEENGAGRSLFYTLGFNVTEPNQNTSNANNIAYSVLNPSDSTITDNLWTTNKSTQINTMQVNVKDRNGNNVNVSITKNSYATDKEYTDEYFSASGEGLKNAFNEIIDEIILQSRYYPTHLEGGSPDFSGYVEFRDKLGDYMEVKHINGILLGDTLFDGKMMASKFANNSSDGLGTVENPTPLGDEFIRAVKTRLGINETTEAQALVAKAFADGQLRYNNENDWSNYIAWYAKADGTYAGFYDEDGTEAVPNGAVYINRSYGFLGETSGSIKNSDMMYMSVQVHTNIETGSQTVVWKIPAALVPMITYLIKLDGTSVDHATNVSISVEDKDDVAPIRLIYETGLRSNLNEFNITSVVETERIASNQNTRVFYNNYFDISAPTHDEHITTISQFTPNKDNERFYYTFDSAVLKKVGNNYELVPQSETPNANGEYYHRRYIFKQGESKPVFLYEKMSSASISSAKWDDTYETLTNEVGAWIVKKGTPARELKMYDESKTVNATNSANMVFHPYIEEQNNFVYIDMNLGNNGLLSVTPATGIKISKTVDVFEEGTSDVFKFRVSANISGSYDSFITKINETPSGEPTKAEFKNGIYEVTLKRNETVWISGIPAGTEYTVEEISDNEDYKIKSIHVNGVPKTAVATGTVAQYLMDDVFFVNTAVGDGDLVITKQVVDQNGNIVDVNDNVKFTMEVTLKNARNEPVFGTFNATGGTLTVGTDGKFTVSLSEGESFVVHSIPEETVNTVTETNIPSGFSFNGALSNVSGIIDSTASDRALIVNDYVPTGTNGADVSVVVKKQISGNRTHWLNGESYTFDLEALGVNGASNTLIATKTITNSDTNKEALFNLSAEQYTAAGTYRYKISERSGTQGGITYDTAERRFAVVVADSDMDGDLEITEVNNEINTTVSGKWLVSAAFNNVYEPTGYATTTINIDKDMMGSSGKNGYQFALYDADPSQNDGANEIVKSGLTDTTGKTAITLNFAADDAGKTYTYYLAEINRGQTINNIKHSETVYKVEVKIVDNLDGTVSANTQVFNLPQGAVNPVFTNEYVPSSSDFVTITGKKTIDGDRVLNANEFEFTISAITNNAPMPSKTTVKNAADGSFSFPSIEFGDAHKNNVYEYYVTESDANKIGGFTYDNTIYKVTVTVADNGDQTITANTVVSVGSTAVSDIEFENKYDAKDAEVVLSGTKILTGKALENGEFSFELTPVTASAPMPTNAVAKNDANGVITFEKISFDKAGTYVYTLAEKDITNQNYECDKSVYTVTVTVTDNSQGTLFAEVKLAKNNISSTEIVFRNSFTPTPIQYNIHADFEANKTLNGRGVAEGEFSFALYNAITGEQVGSLVKNDSNGTFAFPSVTLASTGIHHFKIVEIAGDEKGVTYDLSSYHIRLEVEQNTSGILEIVDKQLHKGTVEIKEVGGVLTETTTYNDVTTNGKITFNNSYKGEEVAVSLGATKILTGRELVDGEFKFDLHKTQRDFLYNENTVVQDDVTLTRDSDGTGNVSFNTLTFDETGIYHYVIVEDELEENGVTPDPTVYEIEITVEDNKKGNLVATVVVNGDEVLDSVVDTIKFQNTYKAAATDIKIAGVKTLNGRTLAAEEFSFALYQGDNLIETVKNKADGTFEFSAIDVEKAGEYIYTVREVGGTAEGVTYDAAVYTVKAVVTDNLDGTFKVEYTYQKGEETATGISFVNTYTAPAAEIIPPQIPKTGESSTIWLFAVIASLSGMLLLGGIVLRKKEEKVEQ